MIVPRHCAKYSKELYPHMMEMLGRPATLLDPMGGVGGIFSLEQHFPDTAITCIEIEELWAGADPRIVQGDAMNLSFDDESFDAICTSPDYGNRMADHHNARDNSRRNTYRHSLGRPLHRNNLAQVQWGPLYRFLHTLVLLEIERVLKPGGLFLLNMKDHYRKLKKGQPSQLQLVTDWYIETICDLGFEMLEHRKVPTRGIRQGANGHLRVEYDSLVLFRKRERDSDDQDR
jgi:SAM-dependent methyltransferase